MISELNDDQKNAAIEHLSFLSGQAIILKDQRQAAVCQSIMAALEKIMSESATLTRLFGAVKPTLAGLM